MTEREDGKLKETREELSLLREFVRDGLHEAIIPKNFPTLSDKFSDFLVAQECDALGSRQSLLYRILRTSPEDDKQQQKFLKQLAIVNSKLGDTSFSSDDNDEIKTPSLFWMSSEEREGLRTLVWIGDDEAINPTNFPSLTFVDEKVVNEIRAYAIKNRINRLTDSLGSRRQGMGIKRSDADNSILKNMQRDIDDLLSKQSGLLDSSVKLD